VAGSNSGLNTDLGPDTEVAGNVPRHQAEESAKPGRWSRLRAEWDKRLDPSQQSVVVSWAAFTTTFVGVRALTHWLRDGHGPSGGGMSVGGQHFHHYNIGIALLAAVGGVGLRGAEKHRHHPATAVAYGSATALIVDELALLLDLKDVYWANDGRRSVDVAVTVIAAGGLVVAGMPLWAHAGRALRSR
jgi:pterin-4a-carbinolamine dehydratase